MRLKPHHLVAVLALVFPATPHLIAQSTASVDPAYTGATMVSGHATPGQAPVTIYDATTRTALGSSMSVDKMGNFAVMVAAPLIAGHSIIVVDRSGAASPATVVAPRPSSHSHQ